jgi:hypothetical protein
MYITEPRFTNKRHLQEIFDAGTPIKIYAMSNSIIRLSDPVNGTVGVLGTSSARPIGVEIKDGYISRLF